MAQTARPPGRAGDPLGPHAAMGRVGAHPLALLDRTIKGTDGKGSYDYSYYDRSVLRESSCEKWHRAAEGPTRVGDVYPAIRGAINLNIHYHVVFLEGVYLNRTDQGLKPRFVKVQPPSDADIAEILQKISRRVIRMLRQLRYLERGVEEVVATGYDPLISEEPELACAMAASVKQRLAFGERAGQQMRRIGSGFGYEGERPALTGPRCASVHGFSLHADTHIPAHRRDQLERLIRYTARGAVALERLHEDARGDLVYTFTKPWSDGTTGITLSPLELLEELVALVPLPRVHLVRYGGCLAPHSLLRGTITPTPRQQGVEEPEASHAAPYWSWTSYHLSTPIWRFSTSP